MCHLRLPLLPITWRLTWLVMMSIGLFLSGCPVNVVSTRRSIDAKASLASFEKNVYPLFEEMKCSSCHYESGEAKDKPFADSNTMIAHTSALEVVAFGDIENSSLVTRQRDGHQCNKNNGECDNNIDKLVEALTEWEKSRLKERSSYLYTEEKDADSETSTLEFSLDGLLKNPTGTVVLTVTATKNTSAQLLTVSNFKLTSPSDPIFIGGLKARRNGIDSAVMSFDRVCALVDKGANNKSLSQYSELAFSLTDGDGSPNKISIGLKDLRIATSEDKCGGEQIVADGSSTSSSGNNYEKQFNDKTSGIGKIISDNCTSSCHNTPTPSPEKGSDLRAFYLFYSKRAEITRRVKCEGEDRPADGYCMPKNATNFPQKQQLLEWLAKLP